MAQPGSPLRSYAQNAEKPAPPEHDFRVLRAQSNPEKLLSDLTNRGQGTGTKEEKLRVFTGKKRAVSLAITPAARLPIKPAIEQPSQKPNVKHRDSAGPPVRTIPGMCK